MGRERIVAGGSTCACPDAAPEAGVAGRDGADEQAPPFGQTTRDAFLGDRLFIRQPERGYRAGIDAVLLAAAVAPMAHPAAGPRVADLGAGVGTVGLSVACRIATATVVLVERDPGMVTLARQNIVDNALAHRVSVAASDVTGRPADLAAAGVDGEAFDAVVANPPYHAVGAGTLPSEAAKAAAHAMPDGEFDLWARAMARLCRPGGTALVVHKAEMASAVLNALDRRFGGLVLLPIHPRADMPAHRVIVRGTKGSRAPLTIAPGLVLHGAGKEFTSAADAILRHAAPLVF